MLDMIIYVWHQLPLIGRLAGPVTQFLSMLECMSMPQAVVLALLGFVGPLRWWTFQFVRLWRTSRVGTQYHNSFLPFLSRSVLRGSLPHRCRDLENDRPMQDADTGMSSSPLLCDAAAGGGAAGGVGRQGDATRAPGVLVQVGCQHSVLSGSPD